MLEFLFNRFADPKATILLKTDSKIEVLSMKFANFLRTPFFHRIPPVAASENNEPQPLFKKFANSC